MVMSNYYRPPSVHSITDTSASVHSITLPRPSPPPQTSNSTTTPNPHPPTTNTQPIHTTPQPPSSFASSSHHHHNTTISDLEETVGMPLHAIVDLLRASPDYDGLVLLDNKMMEKTTDEGKGEEEVRLCFDVSV
jgi:hypothetical protein